MCAATTATPPPPPPPPALHARPRSQWSKLQAATHLLARKKGSAPTPTNDDDDTASGTTAANSDTAAASSKRRKKGAGLTIQTAPPHAPQTTVPRPSSTLGNRPRQASSLSTLTSSRLIRRNPFTNLLRKASLSRGGGGGSPAHVDNKAVLLPDRLKVFVGTWNMYGRLLPIDLGTFLTDEQQHDTPRATATATEQPLHLDSSTSHPYHILAIGTQECERDISEALIFPSKELWERRLQEHLGPSYKLIRTETLAALHLAVFVWKPVLHHVKAIQCDRIKTGWANMVGNKGAVAISLLFGSRSLLFINCHLRAHQTKVTERNANVHRILHELRMPDFETALEHPHHCHHHHHDDGDRKKLHRHASSSISRLKHRKKGKDKSSTSAGSGSNGPHSYYAEVEAMLLGGENEQDHHSVLDRFDHVFMFGDTNYRINAERPKVLDAIQRGDFKSLLQYDQLSVERQSPSSPLAAFREHPINFPPTYKLDAVHYDDDGDCSSDTNSSSDEEDDDYSPWDWLTSSSSSRRSTAHTTPTTATSPVAPPPVPPLPKTALAKQPAVPACDADDPITTSVKKASSTSAATTANKPTRHKKQRSLSAPVMGVKGVGAPERKLVAPGELCYDSSPKQRVPSWTDRILWHDRPRKDNEPTTTTTVITRTVPDQNHAGNKKSKKSTTTPCWWKKRRQAAAATRGIATTQQQPPPPNKDTLCWFYGAVLDEALVGVSDHMPVIGVYGIWFDEWQQQPTAPTATLHTQKNAPTAPAKEAATTAAAERRKSKPWWKRIF